MRLVKSLSAIAGLLVSATATAVTWDTGSPPDIALNNTIYCNQTGACQPGTGLTGSVIKIMGYSTPTATTSGSTSPGDLGNWVAGKVAMYGGGLGVANSVQSAAVEAGTPQHGIDNRGVTDLLIIDFGSDNWDVSSFEIGYTCAMSSSTSADTNTCTNDAAVNTDAWLGGTGAINFNTVSFSAGGVPLAPGFGTFTSLVTTNDNAGEVTRVNSDPVTTNALGRYLIISGSLAGKYDAFKVKAISADLRSPPGGGGGSSVPVPGSVPLTAVALLSLFWISRRRAVPIRR